MSSSMWKWAPALICVLIVSGFSLIFHYRAPYHDHWDLIPFYEAMKADELALRDLFALHGNHWHASGYLVQLALSRLTDMGHWAESLASIGFALIGFIALLRMLLHSMTVLSVPRAAAWVIGLSAFFFFSLDQSANWLWGWQVAVFINLAGALWTIERLSLHPVNIFNASLAAIACTIAVYAFATGWALIPIGFVLLLTRGKLQDRKTQIALFIWSLMSGYLLLHYFLAMTGEAAQYSSTALPDLSRGSTWLGLLHYTFNFIASPIIRFARDSSLIVAAIGSSLFVWGVFKLRPYNPWQDWSAAAPYIAMAAYAFGAGFLTALGRWEQFGTQHAFVSRYISFGTFFWIAVFVMAVFAIERTSHRTHKRTFAVLGLLLVLKLGNIPSVVQKQVRVSGEIAAAAEHVAETYPNIAPEMYAELHAPTQYIEPHLKTLFVNRASFFEDVPADMAALPPSEEIAP